MKYPELMPSQGELILRVSVCRAGSSYAAVCQKRTRGEKDLKAVLT